MPPVQNIATRLCLSGSRFCRNVGRQLAKLCSVWIYGPNKRPGRVLVPVAGVENERFRVGYHVIPICRINMCPDTEGNIDALLQGDYLRLDLDVDPAERGCIVKRRLKIEFGIEQFPGLLDESIDILGAAADHTVIALVREYDSAANVKLLEHFPKRTSQFGQLSNVRQPLELVERNDLNLFRHVLSKHLANRGFRAVEKVPRRHAAAFPRAEVR